MMSRLSSGVLLCVLGAVCVGNVGCIYSQKVWVDGYASESLKFVDSVRVSASGDICVVYAPNLVREVYERTGALQAKVKPKRFAKVGARRAIILTGPDLRRLAHLGGSGTRSVIRAAALKPLIRPRSHTAHAHNVRAVEGMTCDWRDVPVVVVEQLKFSSAAARKTLKLGSTKKEKKRFKRRLEQMAEEFKVKEKERQERAKKKARKEDKAILWAKYLEVPDGQGARIMLQIPGRRGYNPWSYPVRVLLVAPAAAADILEAAVVGTIVVISLPYLIFK